MPAVAGILDCQWPQIKPVSSRAAGAYLREFCLCRPAICSAYISAFAPSVYPVSPLACAQHAFCKQRSFWLGGDRSRTDLDQCDAWPLPVLVCPCRGCCRLAQVCFRTKPNRMHEVALHWQKREVAYLVRWWWSVSSRHAEPSGCQQPQAGLAQCTLHRHDPLGYRLDRVTYSLKCDLLHSQSNLTVSSQWWWASVSCSCRFASAWRGNRQANMAHSEKQRCRCFIVLSRHGSNRAKASVHASSGNTHAASTHLPGAAISIYAVASVDLNSCRRAAEDIRRGRPAGNQPKSLSCRADP